MTSKDKTKSKPRGRFHGRIEHADERACEWQGCKEAGEFRAPRDRAARGDQPPQWRWFCLDHVREYNESWNYFDGLTAEEIIASRSGHPSWQGKTYPFGMNPNDIAGLKMRDSQGIFSSDPRFARFAEGPRRPTGAKGAAHSRPMDAKDARALAILGLDEKASTQDIKARYKALLKRYHPDANHGDRRGEKKMQAVIAAYHRLMDA